MVSSKLNISIYDLNITVNENIGIFELNSSDNVYIEVIYDGRLNNGPVSRISLGDLKLAIQKNRGNITKTAELLNISRETIYDHLGSNPETEIFLYNCRYGGRIYEMDVAEANFQKIIRNVDEQPALALNGLKFFLEKHGEKRGWGPKKEIQSDKPPNHSDYNRDIENMKLKAELNEYKSKARQELERSDPQV